VALLLDFSLSRIESCQKRALNSGSPLANLSLSRTNIKCCWPALLFWIRHEILPDWCEKCVCWSDERMEEGEMIFMRWFNRYLHIFYAMLLLCARLKQMKIASHWVISPSWERARVASLTKQEDWFQIEDESVARFCTAAINILLATCKMQSLPISHTQRKWWKCADRRNDIKLSLLRD
jgi:hypothetical protein